MPLQESYDNAGLQVGLTEAEVSGVLLCLDITEEVLEEAKTKGCNMVVSHHPLIFGKLAQITDANYVQRCVMQAIKNDITIVSMHTNLDSVQGGVNYMMAEKLKLQEVEQIDACEVDGKQSGMGVTGILPSPMPADTFIRHVKHTFSADCVMTNGTISRPIRKVALCGGAGSFVLERAISLGADAFVTGEMSYHTYFGHKNDIQIAVIGHYESEQYTTELLANVIANNCNDVRVVMSEINTNPIKYN